MRTLLSSCLALAGLAATPSQLAAEERVVREPTSNWHVSLEDGICRASRAYGDTMLTFEHYGLHNGFTIMVAGDAVNRSKARYRSRLAREVNVQFGPAYDPHPRAVDRGRIKEVGDALVIGLGGMQAWVDHDENDDTPKIVPDSDPKAVRWVEIEQNHKDYLRLAIPGFGSAYPVLEICVDQLVESWGLDPAGQRTLAEAPRIPKDAGWLSDINFPYRELDEGIDGRFWLRFMIDAEGRATSCESLRGTHRDRFQKHCDQLAKIARFEPARTKDGEPVASYLVTSILYRHR